MAIEMAIVVGRIFVLTDHLFICGWTILALLISLVSFRAMV
jgi:hypothetical protein